MPFNDISTNVLVFEIVTKVFRNEQKKHAVSGMLFLFIKSRIYFFFALGAFAVGAASGAC